MSKTKIPCDRVYVYVLRSRKFKRQYVGISTDLERRLLEHNYGRTKSTKAFIPWQLVYYEEFQNYQGARRREKYFKTAAGRRFLKSKLDQ